MLKIFTFAWNRPDFIELQLRCFRMHLREEFEFTVFNNALFSSRHDHDRINQTCGRLGLRVIDIRRDEEEIERCGSVGEPVFDASGAYTSASVSTGYALCWAWRNVLSEERGPVCVLDSDMFLVRPVALTDFLQEHVLCFVAQNRGQVRYAWNGLVLADVGRLPEPEAIDWYCGKVDGVAVDTGGQTHHYLKAHPQLRIFHIQPSHISDDPSLDFHPSRYERLCFDGSPVFLHYGAGSNWNRMNDAYHAKKLSWLISQIEAPEGVEVARSDVEVTR